MRTATRKRTTKAKPRARQKSLFEKSEEPKLLGKWRAPKIDRQADPNWIFSFLDPHNVGVEVEIPQWLLRRGQGGQRG